MHAYVCMVCVLASFPGARNEARCAFVLEVHVCFVCAKFTMRMCVLHVVCFAFKRNCVTLCLYLRLYIITVCYVCSLCVCVCARLKFIV